MGKLMALFSIVLGNASLIMAQSACASLIFISMIDFPSLVCVDPKYYTWSASSSVFPFIYTLVFVDAVDKNFAFVEAY